MGSSSAFHPDEDEENLLKNSKNFSSLIFRPKSQNQQQSKITDNSIKTFSVFITSWTTDVKRQQLIVKFGLS